MLVFVFFPRCVVPRSFSWKWAVAPVVFPSEYQPPSFSFQILGEMEIESFTMKYSPPPFNKLIPVTSHITPHPRQPKNAIPMRATTTDPKEYSSSHSHIILPSILQEIGRWKEQQKCKVHESIPPNHQSSPLTLNDRLICST